MNAFVAKLCAVIWDDPTKIFSLVNTIILILGGIFTYLQIRAARRVRLNTALSHIFAQLSDHNNATVGDSYRRAAVEQFSPLNIPKPGGSGVREDHLNTELSRLFARLSDTSNPSYSRFRQPSLRAVRHKEERNSEELSRLYWGARAFHIGLINLLAQVWLLSGRPKKLRGSFHGWENLAHAVVGEMTGKTSASKPDWYRNACEDLWRPIEDNRVYPRGFAEWLKRC